MALFWYSHIQNKLHMSTFRTVRIFPVWSKLSDTKGRTQIEDVWEQGTEENIWT
jgi:hypothetical protein